MNEAFSSVKQAIVDLLQAAGREDSSAIADNRLSPMFKGKILFVYHPEQFAPIYSEEHLEHFVSELDLSGSFRRGTDMQISLMEYRATWPDLMAQPVPLYMRLLYDLFGYPPHDDSTSAGSARVPILNKAVEGAEFISHMPALSPEIKGNPKHRGTPNYEAHGKQLKRIGDRGEAVVFAMEKKRLLQAGRPDLADHIKHPSQEDDSIGYDILSFDEDGTDRPIEVKATSARNLDRGFYLTSNELEKAGTLPNYHIYLVFSALGNRPRVLPIKQPAMNGGDFHLNPVVYHATLPAHGVES